ncbi:FmdB family zinc ribbon protein [Achromobacter sp. Root565]|uniref:FmdB family zinc ribbon protein n=1 Tax=Achromobacter sp. Root565 TaxID=1736564 RepID=UPI0007021102|nr:FmdB family zinc ribbon protein [Achromobacter sp. Root565]KQZ96397.1 FmdB family transcriptional regulator [Achromobacter sp. Root565]
MPIYAYKCSACGHAKDVLQKISDAPLSVCPECGQSTFSKQVTAAGFQLKGSGWYVTDFRNNGSGNSSSGNSSNPGAAPASAPASADSAAPAATPAAAPAAAPAPTTPAAGSAAS